MVKVQGFDLPISKRQLLKNILLVTKVKTLKQSFHSYLFLNEYQKRGTKD